MVEGQDFREDGDGHGPRVFSTQGKAHRATQALHFSLGEPQGNEFCSDLRSLCPGAQDSQVGRPGLLPKEGRDHLETRVMAFRGYHRIRSAGKLGQVPVSGKMSKLYSLRAKPFSLFSVIVEGDFPGRNFAGNFGKENSHVPRTEYGQSGRSLKDFVKESGLSTAGHPQLPEGVIFKEGLRAISQELQGFLDGVVFEGPSAYGSLDAAIGEDQHAGARFPRRSLCGHYCYQNRGLSAGKDFCYPRKNLARHTPLTLPKTAAFPNRFDMLFGVSYVCAGCVMPKNRFAFFRAEIRPIEEAKISIMTSGLHYGIGVFEGIRAFWNEEKKELFVFRVREHYLRLLRSAHILLIDIPYSADELCQITVELLRREGFREDVYIRPIVFKSSEEIGVRLHNLESDLAIFALPFKLYLPEGGIRVMVSSWRRVEDNAIPARAKITGAYVNSALAKTEAYLAGFDEAIILNEDGQVAEGSAENIFIVRQGTLITPPVTANILEGITRDTVITLARDLGIVVEERPVDRTELYMAEEVFLCGSAAGLSPVVEIDRRKIGTGEPGPIFLQLQELYENVVRGKVEKYRGWCTPVYSSPSP